MATFGHFSGEFFIECGKRTFFLPYQPLPLGHPGVGDGPLARQRPLPAEGTHRDYSAEEEAAVRALLVRPQPGESRPGEMIAEGVEHDIRMRVSREPVEVIKVPRPAALRLAPALGTKTLRGSWMGHAIA